MQQVSKQSVNYRNGTDKKHCGNCVMYHDHKCDLVEGEISPYEVCDRWEAKTVKSEDLEMVVIELRKMSANMNDLLIKADELAGIDDKLSNELNVLAWEIRRNAYPRLVKLFDAGFPVSPHEFGWDVEQLVSDDLRIWLCKSEETPYLSSHHAPIGHEGLWHTPNKKHPQKEQLPAYIQNVRNALMRAGHGEQEAHAMAVAAVKRWAAGEGAWGHKGKVTPVVREAAQRAVAEWEKLKEEHSG